MSRKIPGHDKDENGIYTKKSIPEILEAAVPTIEAPNPDISLDDIGKRIITAMDRATKTLLVSITAGNVDRDTIGALKDCQAMLKDLKKDEKDYLSSLGDEQLNAVNIK